MKEKDTIRKNVITMVRAAILQQEKDKKIEMNDFNDLFNIEDEDL